MSEVIHSTGVYVRAARSLRLGDRSVTRVVKKMREAMPWIKLADIPAAGER